MPRSRKAANLQESLIAQHLEHRLANQELPEQEFVAPCVACVPGSISGTLECTAASLEEVDSVLCQALGES